MPYVKISQATKHQAMDKLASGMNLSEVAKMFGISTKTLASWQSKQGVKPSLARTPSQSSNARQTSEQDSSSSQQTDEQDGAPIEFQDSPDPVGEHKSIVDQGMDSLKGLLGIKDKSERGKSTAAPLSAKLDAKRQAFVDNVSPTVSLAFTLSAAWMWGRIGTDYRGLAPDEKTAQRICEPLVRIYARHASFLTDVNPDWADGGASLVALIGYVYTSLGMYQQIKQEKEASEEDSSSNVSQFPRQYRSSPSQQSSTSNAGSGRSDVYGGDREYGTGTGGNVGHQQSVNRPDLTGKEAAQFAALSRLSQLDYQHRARRSSRV